MPHAGLSEIQCFTVARDLGPQIVFRESRPAASDMLLHRPLPDGTKSVCRVLSAAARAEKVAGAKTSTMMGPQDIGDRLAQTVATEDKRPSPLGLRPL